MLKKFSANFKNSKSHFSFLISLCVVLGCVTPVHAADLTDIYNQVVLIRSNLSDYYTGSQGLLNQVQTINSRLYQYLPSLNDIKSSVSSIDTKAGNISTMLNTMNNNLVDIDSNTDGIESALGTSNSWLSNINGNLITNVNQVINSNAFLSNIAYDTRQLQEVLANATDAAIRSDQESRVGAINSDFLSSSGNNSVSLSDIGNLSGGMSDLKSGLSSTASPDDALSWINGTDAWGWFDVSTKNDLDRVNPSRGNLRSSTDSNTPYLDNYYNAIYVYLGIGGDER